MNGIDREGGAAFEQIRRKIELDRKHMFHVGSLSLNISYTLPCELYIERIFIYHDCICSIIERESSLLVAISFSQLRSVRLSDHRYHVPNTVRSARKSSG